MSNFKTIKSKALKNPLVKRAYNESELEFSIIRQIIDKRLKKGMSQKDFAKKIGTQPSAISRMESGRFNPTLSFLKKISQTLGGKLEVKI